MCDVTTVMKSLPGAKQHGFPMEREHFRCCTSIKALANTFKFMMEGGHYERSKSTACRFWTNAWRAQGGGTPIYSVLRSSSSVKMKVKGQPSKKLVVKNQNCLAGNLAFYVEYGYCTS